MKNSQYPCSNQIWNLRENVKNRNNIFHGVSIIEDNDIIAFFMSLVLIVVVVMWFFFVIRYFVLGYKHDSYIEKHFPELTKTESLSIFGINHDVFSICMNILSSTKAAPDEYVSVMRRKIRYSILGALLSLTVVPIGLFALLVLFLALRYWIT